MLFYIRQPLPEMWRSLPWSDRISWGGLHSAMSPNYDCLAGENVQRSSSLPPWNPVLSGESPHHHRCLDSVDHRVVRDRDFLTDLVVQSAILLPADLLNTREAHCGKHELSFPNIYFKKKISVLVFTFIKWIHILNKFRCKEEARRINIIIKKS